MTPIGMSESIWPLDLRVSTDVSVVDTATAATTAEVGKEVNSSRRMTTVFFAPKKVTNSLSAQNALLEQSKSW